MSDDRDDRSTLGGGAETLRREFDRSFAAPARAARGGGEDLIAVRLAGEGYALRRSAIAGLFAARTIVSLPGAPAELLGLAALRGRLVAVYDLGALLGSTRSASPGGIALAVAADGAVGLAFEELVGQLRAAPEDLACHRTSASRRRQVSAVARTGAGLLSLVDVAAVLATIQELARRPGPPEER